MDLSYNSICSNGTIEIAVGLRMDEHIQYINMSGNPIGDSGGRALLESMNYHKGQREICMYNCSFEDTTGSQELSEFNLSYPTGHYELDMSSTRNKCILFELIRLASLRRGCGFRNVELHYFPGNASGGRGHTPGNKVLKRVQMNIGRRVNPCSLLGEAYVPWNRPNRRPRHPYTQMEALDWMEKVEKLKPVDKSTGFPFRPPDHGVLSFDFIALCRPRCPIESLNASGQRRLVQLINSHSKERSSILRISRSLLMESYQLHEILQQMEPKFRKEAFVLLLPCVRDTSNVAELMELYAPGLDNKRNVYSYLKNMYYICLNSFSGHYTLDLRSPIDRMVGIRLMEISAHENFLMGRVSPIWKSSGHGHTAQKQNRSNFRNEIYGRFPLPQGLTDEFFSKGLCDKTLGILEFDFVSTTRPMLGFEAPSFSDDVLERLLDENGFFTNVDSSVLSINMGPLVLKHSSVTYAKPIGERKQRGGIEMNKLKSDFAQIKENSSTVSSSSLSTKELGSLDATGSPLQQRTGLIRTSTHGAASMMKQGTMQRIRKARVKKISNISLFGGILFDAECLLDPDKITTVDEILQFATRKRNQRRTADKGTSYIEKVLSLDDGAAILSDIQNELSMFSMDGNGNIDRIIINLMIRVLNEDFDWLLEPIAMLRRTDDKKYELYGNEVTDRNRLSFQMLDILGLSKENAYYDIGLFAGPSPHKLLPTHRRWILNDDVILSGSEIHLYIHVSDWNSDSIASKVREVMAQLFGCFGVTENCIRISSHKSEETKRSSEFTNYRFRTECINNTRHINHMVDVFIEGVAFTDKLLIKANSDVYNRLTGKSDSYGCIWRWRPRTGLDRGSSKIDYNFGKSILDIWGSKFFILRTLLSNKWISTAQALNIVVEFPQFGHEGQPFRESCLLTLFSRIMDLANFHSLVENSMPLDSHASLFNRIGWLNCLNAFAMDRFFQMDLSYADNRLVASILAKLAAVEPGQNCIDPHFRRSVNDNYSRGWEMPANWLQENESGQFDSVPFKGKFNIRYTSAAENGCKVVPQIRQSVQEKYLLLGVPRLEGVDPYMDIGEADWDGIN